MPAQAAGTLAKIKASKTLLLGYRQASVPFSYTGDDNQPWGYSIDLCTGVAAAIARELRIDKLQLRWLPVTPENRIAKVLSGEVNLECGSTTSSLSRMEEVIQLADFVNGASSCHPAGRDQEPEGPGWQENCRRRRDDDQQPDRGAGKDGVAAEMVKVGDHQQGIDAMTEGRVDAYASDRALLISLALDSGKQDTWSLAGEIFSYEPYA